MILRPYQAELINNVRTAYSVGHAGVILQLMTGAGKTFTALKMAASVPLGHRHVLVIVHRHELVAQWVKEAGKLGLTVGIMAAKYGNNPHPEAIIQICMVQTLARRIQQRNNAHRIHKRNCDPFDNRPIAWIIIDECHLATSESYLKIYRRYHLARRLGLTATPARLDGKGFPWATSLELGPDYFQLQQDNALVPFTTYTIDRLNYAGLRKKFGDYSASSQAVQFETQPLIGNVVDSYIKLAPGRTGLTFATTREHARKLHLEYMLKGINAEYLDGDTPTQERNRIIRDLHTGSIQQLVNVDVCIEGLNVPRISSVSIARATCSITRWRQMAGRALRPMEGKENAIILDHGGNALRHGNLDYHHEWTLKARKPTKKQDNGIAKAKLCEQCAGVMPANIPICTICGYDLTPKSRELKSKDGKLIELKSGAKPMKVKPKRRKELESEIAAWLTNF
jgi:DNA repair protein RadD